MIRYLLGQLDPDEQAELDERAFVDDAFTEKVDLAADDLIDAYLSGDLAPDARQRFEIHFLASRPRRERFRFIRALRTVAARQAAPRAPKAGRLLTWVAAAALVLASLTALFFYGRLQATQEQVARVPTPTATDAPAVPPVPARTLTISVPDPARAVAIAVGPELSTVRFAIPVPEAAAPSYSVTVRHEGQTIWTREDVVPRAAGAPLEVGIPAEVLASGPAILSIQAEPAQGASPDPQAATREWKLRIVRR